MKPRLTNTNDYMKNSRRTLKPVAIALQGLVAVAASATWIPSGGYHGTGYYSTSDPNTSYTQAKYDRSGYSLTINRKIQGFDRVAGIVTVLSDQQTGSFVAATDYWSEDSFSYGYCEVKYVPTGDNAWAALESSY